MDLAKVRPLNGRVLVEKIGEYGARQSPLWRAADNKEVVWEGRVLAVPEPPALCDLKAGDLVLYGKYAGRRVTLDGKEYIMMLEDSILGIVAETPIADAATDGTLPPKTPKVRPQVAR